MHQPYILNLNSIQPKFSIFKIHRPISIIASKFQTKKTVSCTALGTENGVDHITNPNLKFKFGLSVSTSCIWTCARVTYRKTNRLNLYRVVDDFYHFGHVPRLRIPPRIPRGPVCGVAMSQDGHRANSRTSLTSQSACVVINF